MPTRSWRRRASELGLGSALLFAAEIGAAEEPDAKVVASREFERGLSLVNEADFEAAVEAFETAYRASPHYSVLYNLGQAYASLGRHVDAVAALEKYLSDGGSRIGDTRRKQVEDLLSRENARIGSVKILVNREEASLFVDGKALSIEAASLPLRLSAGVHVISAAAPGWRPVAVSLEMRAGESSVANLVLVPELPEETSGSLVVLPHRPTPKVTVDGLAYDGGPLKLGSHRVRVQRAGFQTWEHNVSVFAGQNTVVQVELEPTKQHRATSDSTSAQRTWALVTGIGGVVFVGAASATYLWNAGRYDDWDADRKKVDAALSKGNTSESVLSKNQELAARASEIQRVDDLAIGMAIGGAALLVTSGILWLTSGSTSHP